MPDGLAFFMHRQLSGEDYDLSDVFGPTDDNRFNHGITLSFNNPDAWVLHAVTAGIVSYDVDTQQLRLTEKLRFTKPRPWPKANAFEHVSAFVYQGVNLDFGFDYASTRDDSLLKRAYLEWAGEDVRSWPYLELLESLEIQEGPDTFHDMYEIFKAEVKNGREIEVGTGQPLGLPMADFTFIIETSMPIRPFDGEPNLFDPVSFWKAVKDQGRILRTPFDYGPAVDRLLEESKAWQYIVEIRDEYNAPLTRPPGSTDGSLDAAHAGALTVTVPGTLPMAGTALRRGMHTFTASAPVTIQVASTQADSEHQCVFWDSHTEQPSAPQTSISLPDPPFHLIIQALRPADWFARQMATFNNRFLGEQRPLEQYTRGNLVTPLIDGRTYFADLVSTLDDLARNSSSHPGFWHMTGWSMDATTEITPGRTMEQLLRQHTNRIILMLWNFDVEWLPDFIEQRLIESKRATREASEIPPQARSLHDRKNQFQAAIHMKIATIDTIGGLTAYCGGIDVAPNRLTDQIHDDSRTEGELGQHDVQLKVVGPASSELDLCLYQRWTDQRGVDPNFPAPPQTASPVDFQLVQVARTTPSVTQEVQGRTNLSFASNGERTIRETLLNAIRRARDYIYIEDQYFSNSLIADALAERLNNGLQFLIVVIPERTWRYHQPQVFDNTPEELAERIRQRYPNAARNVRICSLTHPGTGEWIYVHAKLQIIDDIFVSCGSANLDVLGLGRDPDQPVSQECNCMIIDERVASGGGRQFARNLRLDLWAEHLQVPREALEQLTPVEAFNHLWETIPRSGQGHVRQLWRP